MGDLGHAPQRAQPLTGGDDGIMVRDLLVIDIPGLCQILITAEGKDILQIGRRRLIFGKPVQVAADLLCHCCGKDPGVRPGISHQLFLVEFLDDPERLIRTDLKAFGTVILKLRQVIEKRRIFLLLLLLNGLDPAGERLFLGQIPDQFLRLLPFLEPVLLVQVKRLEIPGAPDRPPLPLKGVSRRIHGTEHPVEGGLYEIPDLPFPAHHHSQHAGHDPAHGDHGIFCVKVTGDAVPVFERQEAGEIDPHQVILLCPKIRRST